MKEMELVESKKQELKDYIATNVSENERNDAYNFLINKANFLNTYILGNKDLFRKPINDQGVNVSAIVLQLNKRSTNVRAVSRTVLVLIGNVDGCNVPSERVHEGYIELEVIKHEDKKNEPIVPGTNVNGLSTTAQSKGYVIPYGANTQQQQVALPQYIPQFKELHSFTPYMISTVDPKVDSLKFGDLICLRDIKAKYVVSKNAVYLNAEGCEKVTGYTMAESYYSLLLHGINNMRGINTKLVPNTKKFVDGDLSTKYGDEFIILKVQSPPDVEFESSLPNNSIVYPMYDASDEKQWKKILPQAPEEMTLRLFMHAIQWEGPICREDNSQSILLEFNAFKEALRGFYIANPSLWHALGPAILSNCCFISMSKINIEKTEKSFINVNNRKPDRLQIGYSGDDQMQTDETPQFDFSLSLNVKGLLVDAPAVYIKIGFPITPAKAKELMNMNPYKANIQTFHIDNIHASNWTPMINLYEYFGEISKLWDNTDVQFRAVTNFRLDEDIIRLIKDLTPKEGDEVVKFFCNPGLKGAQLPQSFQRVKLAPISGSTIIVCPFAIFNSRLCHTMAGPSKAFIEGQKVEMTDDEEEDALSHPVFDADGNTQPSQPRAIAHKQIDNNNAAQKNLNTQKNAQIQQDIDDLTAVYIASQTTAEEEEQEDDAQNQQDQLIPKQAKATQVKHKTQSQSQKRSSEVKIEKQHKKQKVEKKEKKGEKKTTN